MNYFVTGATGLVGRHLVAELLKREDARRIQLLVRPDSLDRLGQLMCRWRHDDRLVPVLGDLTHPQLTLEPVEQPIDHLFHVAAAYHLELDWDRAWATNVEGTRRVVEWANERRVGRFHHTSTNGVAGRYRGRFLEDMLDEGQVIDHPYFQTKWHAERLVRTQLDVPLRVYRPGTVVGRSDTGEMDKIDGAYYFFGPVRSLARVLPRWVPLVGPDGGKAWIVPVDFVARAMDHIAHLPDERLRGSTFHLLDPRPPSVGAALNEVARVAHGPRLVIRVDRRVTRRVAARVRRVPGALRLRDKLLSAAAVPRQALEWRDFDAEFDTANTHHALAGTDIAVPPLDRYVETLYRFWEQQLEPDAAARALRAAVAGCRILVTGASSGIGRALALRLARAGAEVLLLARRRPALEALAEEIAAQGGRCLALPTDLTHPERVEEAVASVLDGGGVDVLVNNAGRSIRRSVANAQGRFHDYERTLAINYLAAVRLTLALLPSMQARGRGQVINVSSIGLQAHMARFTAYNPSKAALDAFARSAAPEVAGDGIVFTTVYMPLVRTRMSAPTSSFKLLPSLSAHEAAALIERAIVRRTERVSSPLGTAAELAGTLAPRLARRAMQLEYGLLPESPAALAAVALSDGEPLGSVYDVRGKHGVELAR